MRKTNFFKEVLILFLLIFLAGCGSTDSFGLSKSTAKPSEINIFTGTQGLTAEFAKTAPPPKVFENSYFPILLRIRNNGAFSINEKSSLSKQFGAVLSISRERDYIPSMTYDNNEVSKILSDNLAKFYIDGKTQISPNGEEKIITATARTGKLDPQSENKESTMTATLCYPYKTMLSTTICIDPDVGKVYPGKRACEVKDLTFSGQGAPLVITRVESQMIPTDEKDSSGNPLIKPQFLIFVENMGKGTSVDVLDYRSACLKTDKFSSGVNLYWNGAVIRAFTTGKNPGETVNPTETSDIKDVNFKIEENELLCCPNFRGECPEQMTEYSTLNDMGYLRFIDKKDFIRCTFKKGISKTLDAYTSPLRIEVTYGYVQTISVPFTIQKPVRY